MAQCRDCGLKIEWGLCDGRWQPLQPREFENDLTVYSYIDDRGELRADHRDLCQGQTPVVVTRLKHKIKAIEQEVPYG